MNLRELLSQGAFSFAAALQRAGQIAPNIIRSVITRFAPTAWRSARALVSRVYESVRAARDVESGGQVRAGDVPDLDKPAGSPYRGIGRGDVEVRIAYRILFCPDVSSHWRTDFVNTDLGATMDQIRAQARAGIIAKLPFNPTDPISGFDPSKCRIEIKITNITRR
jgi:hypothetical protein